jgi:hypothetical protein
VSRCSFVQWWRSVVPAALVALVVGACASVPSGPSVMALPGDGKSMEQFSADDGGCRQYAAQHVQSSSGGPPRQYQFDMAYMQCMYAKGHRVPVAGGRGGYTEQGAPASRGSLPAANVPAPPSGSPPPPPPGATR